MRVISGQYRGLPLATLKGDKLRPTSDQLRETLFDVLGPGIEGVVFLDAYAGTGAVGIEAISRGAADVVFIEHHKAAAEVIKRNLLALEIESGYRIMTNQVLPGSSGWRARPSASTWSFSTHLTPKSASITMCCDNSGAARL